MFYYLDGVVAHMEPYLAVIDCGGVGYACKTTNTTLGQLQKGKNARLYTPLNVAEGVFDLYGFATQGELGSFRQLINVSGVGPKAALSILSSNTPEGLVMNIVTGNEKAIMAAPGVGKKIAQRVILELKDKLAKETREVSFTDTAAFTAPAVGGDSKLADASAALAVLGYSAPEINAALKGVDTETMTLEEIIKAALKRMMK